MPTLVHIKLRPSCIGIIGSYTHLEAPTTAVKVSHFQYLETLQYVTVSTTQGTKSF